MIEVKNLVKHYGGIKAVDDISFTVEKGSILGFLGPNGAGKSTTMNILTGYISASSGNALIDGVDILADPIRAKRNIGYLPEQPPLYLDMTAYEYLCFVYELKGSHLPRNTHLKEIIELVGIGEMQNRLIRNLSKGYRQRVGLGGALVGNPPVLILDEPTVGLDPKQISDIRTLIKQLGENHTVILSSHILPEIQAVCDKVVIINRGKIGGRLDIIGGEIVGDTDSKVADISTLTVRLKEGESADDMVKKLSKVAGVESVARAGGVTLEEVFLKLTGGE